MIDELIPRSKKFEMPSASEVIKLKSLLRKLKKDDLTIKFFADKFEIKNKNSQLFNISEFTSLIEQPLIESYFSSKKVQKILNKKKLYFLSQNKNIDKESFKLIENNKKRFMRTEF